MKMLKNCAAATILSLSSFGAFAAPILDVVGDVSILGSTYSVSILYDSLGNDSAQSYNALNPTQTFFTEADATAAVNALYAAFPLFDWNPGETGIGGTRVVYSVGVTSYDYMVIEDDLFGSVPDGPYNILLGDVNRYSFAQFTLSAVPEPATFALLSLGLAWLGLTRRRRLTG